MASEKPGLERYLMVLLTKSLQGMELRLVRIECKIESIESRLEDLAENMRKILERPERRRWLT
ncbi:MAG TPA: hypothetical protein ENF79_03395 [Nitrososphaeria archaeon]|nr:hypothetical protein [Nitrososphaeria archaeon]